MRPKDDNPFLETNEAQPLPINTTDLHLSSPFFPKFQTQQSNWFFNISEDSKDFPQLPNRIQIPILNRKVIPIWRRVRFKLFVVYSLRSLARQFHLIGGQIDVLRRNQIPNSKSLGKQKAQELSQIRKIKLSMQPSRCNFILHPKGSIRKFWNILLILILAYTAIIMPYQFAFLTVQKDGFWYWFELIIDVLFISDILVNFLSAYQDDTGQIITSHKKIALYYLKTWFLIDVLASFPLDLILDEQNEDEQRGQTDDLNNFLRLLRVPRLNRLIKLGSFLKNFNSEQGSCFSKLKDLFGLNQSAVRLIKSFLVILVIMHIFACLWYFTARLEGFHFDTWVVRAGLLNQRNLNKYICSLYWTITSLTTVGYGDITPKTVPQKFLAIFLMLSGMYIVSFTIGSLASLMSSIDSKNNQLFNKLSTIDHFSKEFQLDRELQRKLKNSIQYHNRRQGLSQEDLQLIFNQLPTSLKNKVAIAMFRGQISKITFFVGRGEVFIGEIVPFLKPRFYGAKEIVYEFQEFAVEVFFIIEGRVNYLRKGQAELVVQSMREGNYFGDIQVVKEILRLFTAQTERVCHLLVMKKDLVKRIKEDFSSVWNELEEVAIQRLEKIQRQIFELLHYRDQADKEQTEQECRRRMQTLTNRIKKKRIAKTEYQEKQSLKELHKKVDFMIHQLSSLGSGIKKMNTKNYKGSFRTATLC